MKPIVQVTASGEEHGLVNTFSNNVPFDDFKHMDPKVRDEVKKQKKEDDKIVKRQYLSRLGMNERLDKIYCRYQGDPIQQWHLIPGHIYDLPKGLVDEINHMKKVKRSGLVSEDGVNLNKDQSPLERDIEANWDHKLVQVE